MLIFYCCSFAPELKSYKMSKIFILFLFLSTFIANAQNKVSFDYDAAGNQILRRWCPSCHSKNENIKDISDIQPSDLQKFSPNDVISYYPNPVKEQLYLKWELIDDIKVSSIKVFSLTGQLIKSYNHLEGKDSYVIQFNSLPQNIYSLVLVYTNGDEKVIKIVKE